MWEVNFRRRRRERRGGTCTVPYMVQRDRRCMHAHSKETREGDREEYIRNW